MAIAISGLQNPLSSPVTGGLSVGQQTPSPSSNVKAPANTAPAAPIDLSGTYANVGGTIYNTKTQQKFSNPAEGRLLLCLGNEHSVDLKAIIRASPNDMTILKHAIVQAMHIKPEKHEFNLHEQPVILRYMNMTGG